MAVGIDSKSKRDAVWRFWSMSSFANLTRGPYSSSSWRKIGSIAWHGPHQGAQKSTTTGPSAWRTSCSKVASLSSCTAPMLQPTEAKRRDLPDRLEKDRLAHLRAAPLAIDERD